MTSQTAARLLRRSVLACSGFLCLAGLSACGGGGGSGSDTPAPAAQLVQPLQTAPTITTQPQTQSVAVGKAATFSVSAGGSGSALLSYQWLRNGEAIPGATAATYTTPAVGLKDSADVLRVSIRNEIGTVTSDAAVLLVEGVGVRTLAGSQTESTLARVDGVGKEARLQFPGPMGIDGAGNLFVVESSRHAIRKVTPAGVVTSYWQEGPAAGTSPHYPRSIAVSASGALYMAVGGKPGRATELRKVAADGLYSTIRLPNDAGDPRAGDGSALPVSYTAVAVDAAGNLYVASEVAKPGPDICSSCFTRATVRKVTPDGKASLLLSSESAPGPMGSITGLAVDKGGNVFVLGALLIVKIDAAGSATTLMHNDQNFINAITVDAAGNLYFTATQFSGRASAWPSGAIGKVTPQGVVSVLADPGKDARFETAALDGPTGIAIDAAGAIYVSMSRTIGKLVLP